MLGLDVNNFTLNYRPLSSTPSAVSEKLADVNLDNGVQSRRLAERKIIFWGTPRQRRESIQMRTVDRVKTLLLSVERVIESRCYLIPLSWGYSYRYELFRLMRRLKFETTIDQTVQSQNLQHWIMYYYCQVHCLSSWNSDQFISNFRARKHFPLQSSG
jgi:hypothetical protein